MKTCGTVLRVLPAAYLNLPTQHFRSHHNVICCTTVRFIL
jgi:hypothetical protein